MSGVLERAADVLRQHYGGAASPGPPGQWETLAAVVLAGKEAGPLPAEVRESLIASPGETMRGSADEIAAAVRAVSRGRQKGATLRTLAGWWVRQFGDEREPACDLPAEQLRDELQALPGVSLELADRLLLFVFGRAAYPLDRASMRIACRHGWLGPDVDDYQEWQAFFVRGLQAAAVDPRDFSHWAARIGRDFCGPRPQCDACPLRPLLPPGGPYEPE